MKKEEIETEEFSVGKTITIQLQHVQVGGRDVLWFFATTLTAVQIATVIGELRNRGYSLEVVDRGAWYYSRRRL